MPMVIIGVTISGTGVGYLEILHVLRFGRKLIVNLLDVVICFRLSVASQPYKIIRPDWRLVFGTVLLSVLPAFDLKKNLWVFQPYCGVWSHLQNFKD